MHTKKWLILSLIIIAILGGIISISINNKNHSMYKKIEYQNIDVINVSYSSSISSGITPKVTIREYKIELKNKKLWYYYINYIPKPYEDDNNALAGSAENRDFVFVGALEDNAINLFLKKAAKAKFIDWKDYYPALATDCPIWQITIEFLDGVKKEISVGAYNNPKSWDDMYKAFYTMTGQEIIYKSNVVIDPTDSHPR